MRVTKPMMEVLALGFSRLHRYRSMNTSDEERKGRPREGTMRGRGRRTKMPSMIIHTKSAIRPAKVCCSRKTPYRALRGKGRGQRLGPEDGTARADC